MDESFDLRRYRRSGSLAWNQYFNSLVNLGCFEEMEPTEDDENGEGESTSQTSPDEIRLTPLGKQLADAYGAELGHPRVLTNLRTGASQVTLRGLEKIGSGGGVCEIMNKGPVDKGLLRHVFFDQVGSPGKSHALRRRSLLLIMDLIRQCAEVDVEFNSATFGDAVLYGATTVEDLVFEFSRDGVFRDVADLWRMFYLHNHLSVALEGAFLGLIRNVEQSERGNVRFESVLSSLDDSIVAETFGTGLGVDDLESFLDSTPAGILSLAGVDEANGRPAIGSGLQLESPLAEWNLAEILRQLQWASLPTPAGVAVSLTPLTTVLLGFDELREHEAALWCARNVRDPYLDLALPLLSNWLSQWDRVWWNRTWDDLAAVVLDRFVIRQHELLGYDKGSGSDSMILHSNDGVLTATGEYGRVTIGNPGKKSHPK
ncbi:MAG: hypothetical protein AAFX79_08145 [Planctomycetota bacterium]